MTRAEIKEPHIRRDSGFTLVELVVSMTLTAIFATAIVAILPAATRIFMKMEDMSRAQIVADMVVDSLREECADTCIEDFASVQIVRSAPSPNGDEIFLAPLRSIVNNKSITLASQIPIAPAPDGSDPDGGKGNVLIIRKSDGYCEAIYSDIAISPADCEAVRVADEKAGTYRFDNAHSLGRSSRAVYRFFNSSEGGSGSADTLQGYVHFGYYPCVVKRLYCTEGDDASVVNCIFPRDRYDYTAPFTVDAYNGYTVSLEFSDLKTTTGDLTTDRYSLRPLSVIVTVRIYDCSYAEQSENVAIYTRSALLVFAEDTTA